VEVNGADMLPVLNLTDAPRPLPPTTLTDLPDELLRQILSAVSDGGAQQACATVQSFCIATRCDDELFAAVLETLGWPGPAEGVSHREAFSNVCRSLVEKLKTLDNLDDAQLRTFMDGKDPTDFFFLPLWDAVLAKAGLARRQPPLQVTQGNIRDVCFFGWGRSKRLETIAEYGPLELWDVSQITDMRRLFLNMSDLKINLKLWDVSSVTTMESMFHGCKTFNRDLPWDTRSLVSTKGMFMHCHRFKGDISTWDTSNVHDMSEMFWDARSFAGDLTKWDVGSVTTFNEMFLRAYGMRRRFVEGWPLQNPLATAEVETLRA